MNKAIPPLDPGHDVRRAMLSKLGLGLIGVGVPCILIGLGLFVSVFFAIGDGPMGPGFSPARPVIGVLMFAAGGFCTSIGWPLVLAGNAGKIMRYQAAEALPVALDMTRHAAPVAGDLARGMARAAREGWEEGGPPSTADPLSTRCECGVANDPDARFCKGCGRPRPNAG